VAGGDLFTAPADRSQEAYAAWARNLSEWRAATRAELDLGLYDEPSLAWAATSFVETQAMIHDRMLFDRATQSWTVDRCGTPVPSPFPRRPDALPNGWAGSWTACGAATAGGTS